MKTNKWLTKEHISTMILLAINIIYGILLVYLHYNQTLYVKGGAFESDLPFHISMAVDDNWYYSFTAFVYVFLYKFSCGNMLVGIFQAYAPVYLPIERAII